MTITKSASKYFDAKDIVAITAIYVLALVLRLPYSWEFHLGGDPANLIKLAWSMRYANSWDTLSGIMYSFGYSFFILLASYILPDMDKAAFAVSILFGSLSCVLVFLMGRRLFGFYTGLAAGIGLALFLPHIHISSSPLSESTYIFWSLVSISMLIAGVLNPKPLYWYAVTGAVAGFTFIIRPEIQITFAFMAAFGLFLLYKRSGVKPARLAMMALLMGVTFLAVDIPKVVWIHKVAGTWMLENRKNATIGGTDAIQKALASNAPYWDLKFGYEESIYGLSGRGELNFTESRSFGRWLLENPGARLSYYGQNVVKSIKNLTKPLLLLLVLTACAVVLGGRELFDKNILLLLSFSPVMFIPFFYSLGGGSWYGRPEAAVVYAPVLVLLGASGLVLVLERLKKLQGMGKTASYALALCVALFWTAPAAALPVELVKNWGTPGPLNESVMLDQSMGAWIDRNLPKDARIMTRSWEISRYSNREREVIPFAELRGVVDYARRKHVDYIIVGGAREWYRPQLDFLIPPNNKASRNLYEKDLDLIAEFETQEVDGNVYQYNAAVYRVKYP